MNESTTGGPEVERCPSCGSRVAPAQEWCTLCHARLGPATEPALPDRPPPPADPADRADPADPADPMDPAQPGRPAPLPPGAAEAMLAELAATSGFRDPLARGPLAGTSRGVRTLLAVGAAVVLVAVGVGLLTLVGLLL